MRELQDGVDVRVVDDDSIPGNSILGLSIAPTEYQSFIVRKEDSNERLNKIIINKVEAKRVTQNKAADLFQEALIMIRNYNFQNKNIPLLY